MSTAASSDAAAPAVADDDAAPADGPRQPQQHQHEPQPEPPPDPSAEPAIPRRVTKGRRAKTNTKSANARPPALGVVQVGPVPSVVIANDNKNVTTATGAVPAAAAAAARSTQRTRTSSTAVAAAPAEAVSAVAATTTTTTTTTASATAARPSLLQRAMDFLDSFHGRQLSDQNTNELDIWRVRCLLAVSWSTGLSGLMLVPLYVVAGVPLLAGTLCAGSMLLVVTPSLYQRRYLNDMECSRLVAFTAVLVMTILTTGSGGFPNGLAPGIQRILPILVMCFGSIELGAAVTLYVMIEGCIFFAIGPFPAAFDDKVLLDMICAGSWLLQPAMLFCLGLSLHMAGTQTVQTLTSVSEAKARFLSIVSHELRTPLHGILGSCDLGLTSASASTCPADQIEALQSCIMAAEHLRHIVEDLLLYSSSAAIRIRNEPFEIGQFYRSLKAMLQQSESSSFAQCKLVFVEPTRPMWFWGDELRLRQCFINVIGNGLKFCNDDDTITVELLEAEPASEEDMAPLSTMTTTDDTASAGGFLNNKSDAPYWKLRFRVQDTGPGITQEDLQRIFSPFEQAVLTTHKSLAGVGLGLSIVVALLNKMDGTITCESQLGNGSAFYLTVQLRKAHDPTEPLSTSTTVHSSTEDVVGRLAIGCRSTTTTPQGLVSNDDKLGMSNDDSGKSNDDEDDDSTSSINSTGNSTINSTTSKDNNNKDENDGSNNDNNANNVQALNPIRNGDSELQNIVVKGLTVVENRTNLPMSSPKVPDTSPTKQKEASASSSRSPVVLATINACDMSCLEQWDGEEDTFQVQAECETWDQLMQSASAKSEVDIIVLDDSDEALRSLQKIFGERELIRYSTPLLRVCRDLSSVVPCSLVDATIHIRALPGLLRSWHRALALGAWILVVDDVALNRKVLRKQLSQLGHRVSEAIDGLDGFGKALAAGFAHDMIAMDIMMPIMDGFVATKRIQEEERIVRGPSARPCPIFAVTACDRSMSTDWSMFNGFLEKPTSVAKLRTIVRHQVIRRLMPA